REKAERLFSLERQVGIHDRAERIREGRFLPDLNETPAEYFSEEHDHMRRGIRRLYFSVQDPLARKKLIIAERMLRKDWEEWWRLQWLEAEQEHIKAKQKCQTLPWGEAAFIALGFVALGYWIKQTDGAIGGAVFGSFIAAGYVSNTKSRRQNELERTQAVLLDRIKAREEALSRPEIFSRIEEETGEESK
ncbi:MAG: hypothetical protein KG075_00330, partial [Alphaproteobacteria bacterium]|nr:hypothetical protein [Alphaproteobacteria bacterium]